MVLADGGFGFINEFDKIHRAIEQKTISIPPRTTNKNLESRIS
ncbi:unnamed protein product, partial [Rotaria sp. Silwood1]